MWQGKKVRVQEGVKGRIVKTFQKIYENVALQKLPNTYMPKKR